MKDPFERPIAAVSDMYELVQHQVLATWLENNLKEANLPNCEATVTMTEFGERLRISIPLTHGETDLTDDLFASPDRYRPEIEIVNSVDRTLAFSVVLRWRRLICLNGIFSVQQDRLRSIHRVDLSRTHVVQEFIARRLDRPSEVMAELNRWKKKRVARADVQAWCEGWLRKKSGWTVENCARLWAILETGFDGTVSRPPRTNERQPLSRYRVGQHRKVPGVSFPVESAYDVAQLLTWITSNQRAVEMQIEGTEDVPRLMKALLKA